MSEMECFKCGKRMTDDEVSVGMNIGIGMQYWCHACAPPPESPEEVIQTIKRFIHPPKEIIKVGTEDHPATKEDIAAIQEGMGSMKKWWVMRGDTDADYVSVIHAKTEGKATELAYRRYGKPDGYDPNNEIWVKPWFLRGEKPDPKPARMGFWDPRIFFDGKVAARGDSIQPIESLDADPSPLGSLIVRFPMVLEAGRSLSSKWIKELSDSADKPIDISHTMGSQSSMKYVGCKVRELKIIAVPGERIVLEALMSYEGAMEGGPLTSSYDLNPARVMTWDDFGLLVGTSKEA